MSDFDPDVPSDPDRPLNVSLQPAGDPNAFGFGDLHFWDLVQLICDEYFFVNTRFEHLETVPPQMVLDLMNQFLKDLFEPNHLARTTFEGRDIPQEIDQLVVEFQLADRAALRQWMWDRLMPIAYRRVYLNGFRNRWNG